MGSREERIGQNEALFREVNERIAEIGFGDVGFLCECGHADCSAPVWIPPGEYEAVREHPARFFVLPGHEIPDVENVVEAKDRYLVIEKRAGLPADVAVATDLRSA